MKLRSGIIVLLAGLMLVMGFRPVFACSVPKILFYNLQSGYTAYNAQATILQNAGYDVTVQTRATNPTFILSDLEQYNVVWFYNGCNGSNGLLSDAELSIIQQYYTGVVRGNLVLQVDSSTGDSTQGPGTCYDRVNQIAGNLGVSFSSIIDRSAQVCWNVSGVHPIFGNGATVLAAHADANISVGGSVTWSSTPATIIGTLSDGMPALAYTPREGIHGGVLYVPNETTFSSSCSSSLTVIQNFFDQSRLSQSCTPGTGSITITKNATGSGGSFDFSVTGPVSSNFNMFLPAAGSTSTTLYNLPPGSYGVTETVPVGWVKGLDTCVNVPILADFDGICSIDNGVDGSPVSNPAPTTTSISPSSKTEGYTSFILTVIGTDFIPSSVISINGLSLTTTYLNSTHLTATIPSGNPVGTYAIAVINSAPGGGTSGSATFTVNSSVVTGSIMVTKTATGGDGAFGFNVTGSGYSIFTITTTGGTGSNTQNNLVPGTYSATESVPSGWTKTNDTCGSITVVANETATCSVTNVKQGASGDGGSTGSITVHKTATGGNATFSFITTGSGFSPFTITTVNGTGSYTQSNLSPGNYSATETVPGSWTKTSDNCGLISVSAGSNTECYVVDTFNTPPPPPPPPPPPACNPVPVITNIIPSSKNEGDPGFTLTVNGSNFLNSSVIYFDSLALSTSYVSSGQLITSISSTPAVGTYDVTVVNPSVCPTLSANTDNGPISLAVSPDGNAVYVANYQGQSMQKFNANDLSLTQTLSVGGNPRYVVVSPDNDYVYLVNNSTGVLQKLNAGDLTEVARAITAASPTGVAVSPDGSSVYVISQNSIVQRFDTASLTLLAQHGTDEAGYALTVSSNGLYVYVINIIVATVQKFDAITLAELASGSIGTNPVAISSSANYVYVASTGSNLIQKLNASNLVEVSRAIMPTAPTALSISPGSSYIYVSYQGSSIIQKLSTANLAEVAQAATYSDGYSNATSADGNFVYVSDFTAHKIQKFYSSLQTDGGTSNAKVFTVNALQQGSLKIIKNTTGGDRSFTFTVSGPSNSVPSITTTNGTGYATIQVNPSQSNNTYSIEETVPNGWTFNSAHCDNSYVFGVNGVTNVQVLPGQTTTCTFNDTKNSITPNTFLKINKDSAGGNSTFTYVVSGPTSFSANITTVGNTGSTGSTPVSFGTFTITEDFPTGWDFSGAGCNNGSGATGTTTANGVIGVTVIAGQTTTCNFGNTKNTIPPQTYLKIVKNTSGGDGTFPFIVSGPTPSNPSITTVNGMGISGPTSVLPGTYVVAENTPNGWIQTDAICDHGTPGAATVVPGQTTTCTFTNINTDTYPGPALKLVKVSNGGDAVFNYTVTGPEASVLSITTDGGLGTTGIIPVASGTYTITETIPNGWSQTFVSCDRGTPQAVLVVDGHITTCTFINTFNNAPGQAALKIVKSTIGGDADFDYLVTGPLGFSQTVQTHGGVGSTGVVPVSVGEYHITETAPSGWNQTSATCTNGTPNTAVVEDGQITTCVFNNDLPMDPQPTTLKIIKNTSGGNAAFTFTVAGPTPSSHSITTVNGTGISGPITVVPGTYSVTETLPGGWTKTFDNCSSITIFAGHTATCTFTNTKDNVGPHIISIVPDAKHVGDLPFTMTVNGTGFVSGSKIYFDGFAMQTDATKFASGKLTTFIAPVPPVGTYDITVVNPSPGGGTSNSVPFTVLPLDNNGTVFANNLGVSDTACPISQGISTAYFFWNYQNTQGKQEKQFQIQISDQFDFTMPIVDRTFAHLSSAPGVQNQQTVQVKLASLHPTTPGCGFINFNKTYYWRVKVWEKNDAGGLGESSEWIEGQPYTTISHPGPYAAFGFSPPIPAPNSTVYFTNNSTCYTVSGPASCSSYAWSFGDSATSAQQNPSHAYNSSGNFIVTMQAYDDLGIYCQAQRNVPIFNNTSTNGLPFFKEISPF